ncbi:MAG: hypothetical protein ACSLE6_20355 [Mycobacterium sp.]
MWRNPSPTFWHCCSSEPDAGQAPSLGAATPPENRQRRFSAVGSLNQAMWLHRAPSFGDRRLHVQRSPSGVGGPGPPNGAIYNPNGQLVCTVIQEGYLGRG